MTNETRDPVKRECEFIAERLGREAGIDYVLNGPMMPQFPRLEDLIAKREAEILGLLKDLREANHKISIMRN